MTVACRLDEATSIVRPLGRSMKLAAMSMGQLSHLFASLSLEHLQTAPIASTSIEECCALLNESRPALLRRLQRDGVAKLADRQKIANALARHNKLIKGEPSTAAAALPTAAEALAAATSLLQNNSEHLDFLDANDSTSGAAALLRTLPRRRLVRGLEAAGLPPRLCSRLEDALTYEHVRIAFYSPQLCERGTESLYSTMPTFARAIWAARRLSCTMARLRTITARRLSASQDGLASV